MVDVENSVQMGELERHLWGDVSPGLGGGVSVEQMQTLHVDSVAYRDSRHLKRVDIQTVLNNYYM